MLPIIAISYSSFKKGKLNLTDLLSMQVPAYSQLLSTRLIMHYSLEKLYQSEQRRTFIRPYVFLTWLSPNSSCTKKLMSLLP
jgi:hypothetical protein